MAYKKNNHSVDNRKKVRDAISQQVQDFLQQGGEIKVLQSALDRNKDPKCRFGDEAGLFV